MSYATTDRALDQHLASLTARRWIIPIVLLIGLVTFGKPWLDIPGFMSGQSHHHRSVDLQLFDDFSDPESWYIPWMNTVGNIALFLPIGGLFAVWAHKRFSAASAVVITTVACLAVSAVIEGFQYLFALGFTDVDDLLSNTIGGLLGGVLFLLLPGERQGQLLRFMGVGAILASITIVGLMLWKHFG